MIIDPDMVYLKKFTAEIELKLLRKEVKSLSRIVNKLVKQEQDKE